jgi:hypothetical protein
LSVVAAPPASPIFWFFNTWLFAPIVSSIPRFAVTVPDIPSTFIVPEEGVRPPDVVY